MKSLSRGQLRIFIRFAPRLIRRILFGILFDLFEGGGDGEERDIEVKGRARASEIEISENEWAKACILREHYWLYVVYHRASNSPELVRIQDPFKKLLARTKGSVLISAGENLQAGGESE